MSDSPLIYCKEQAPFRDHCGGDAHMSTNTFRRSIHKMYAIAAGKPVPEWVKADCSFAFVEIFDRTYGRPSKCPPFGS